MKTYCINSIQNLTVEERDNVHGGTIFPGQAACMAICMATTGGNYELCLRICGLLPF